MCCPLVPDPQDGHGPLNETVGQQVKLLEKAYNASATAGCPNSPENESSLVGGRRKVSGPVVAFFRGLRRHQVADNS